MKTTLYNRHLLSLGNHTSNEIHQLISLSAKLKSAKINGQEKQYLTRKNIALIFEKPSTRTRCAFEVASYDQGANVTYIDPQSSQMGNKESIKDTARVLGRMYDAIQYRGSCQSIVETLAQYAGVPVYNGLTNEFHPTQMLADMLTMQEHCNKPLHQTAFTFCGDARNNVGRSLLLVGAKLGMDVRIFSPDSLIPNKTFIKKCQEIARTNGATITITDDANTAVNGTDFIHTDVWVSMGEVKETWQQRIKLLQPYQVNSQLIEKANNSKVKFMHCLPAFHNSETTVGKQIIAEHPELSNGMEVTEDIFESECNVAFDQAENRMHTIKAVLVASLCEDFE